MTPLLIATAFFCCLFVGTLLGSSLQKLLPDHHIDSDSRDTMKMGIGLIATLTALVLGLVTADAKNSFQTMDTTMQSLAADVLTLDRYLAQYGSETQPLRQAIKTKVAERIEAVFSEGQEAANPDQILQQQLRFEQLQDALQSLPESTDRQRRFKTKALDTLDRMLQKRWLFLAQEMDMGLPIAFLGALLIWLTLIFGSLGLYAPRNRTVHAITLACCFSVAASIFLILELNEPFTGLIHISPKPLLVALEVAGR